MCPSSAVAMLVCLSMNFLRSCSSGKDATALTNFCVFEAMSPSSSPSDVWAFTSAMAFLYAASSFSTSSATLGNCASSFAVQKGSLSCRVQNIDDVSLISRMKIKRNSKLTSKSYDFLPAAASKALLPCVMSTRLSLMPRTSWTSGA